MKKKLEVKIIAEEVFIIEEESFYDGSVCFINDKDELTTNLKDTIKYKIIASSLEFDEIALINKGTKDIIIEYNIPYVYVGYETKKYIDPASGWKYGFPMLIDDNENEIEFLLKMNYPKDMVHLPYYMFTIDTVLLNNKYAMIYLSLKFIQM